MYLMYLDESGNTGLDLDNKHQPFFVLAGISVLDKNWHEINDYFEREKLKIYPDLKNIEIHTNELFNTNKKSPFYKNSWQYNLQIAENIVDLISSLNINLFSAVIHKSSHKEYFGNNIAVDPYLYSFAVTYEQINNYLKTNNNYGIIFCDEIKKMEKGLKILYPKLKENNRNIIEKTFYLDSKKNNFIQIADVYSFYINKYNCITSNSSTMDILKKEHCIKMFNKIQKLYNHKPDIYIPYNDFDKYFV